MRSQNPQLVDVPRGKINCSDIFYRILDRVPSHIGAEIHSKGSHTGRGTTWAGEYWTYEIYDKRRPEWPTEEVEEIRNKIEWAIIDFINQLKEMKVR